MKKEVHCEKTQGANYTGSFVVEIPDGLDEDAVEELLRSREVLDLVDNWEWLFDNDEPEYLNVAEVKHTEKEAAFIIGKKSDGSLALYDAYVKIV